MKYQVIKSFYLFEYNPKNQGHKIRKYDVNDVISESTRNRISQPNRETLTRPLCNPL